ncbi:MAG TPA: hypothetical protein VMN82_06500 [Thermoanaerobaculia bacterium]|nr:hypothetical protein [Thermoanaerobaculia bacterium]
MARRKERAPAPRRRSRLDARAAIRLGIGFAAGLAFWFVFSAPYEKAVAAAAGTLVRLLEHPSVTTLSASGGEFLVDRSDFPPASPRPGLPADDLHFNFVLLATLFALAPRPLEPRRFGRFWLAAAGLAVIHVIALVFQVQALYATRLGPWSEAHYGPVARNFWAAGFHFYQIAGRFAAPFALWWGLGRDAAGNAPGG